MTRPRYLLASFVAPVVALAIPTLLAISQLYAEVEILPDGSADDAAMRGAGTFIVVGLPVLYILSTIFYAIAGHVLARIRLLKLKTTVLTASVAPWPLIALAAVGLMLNNGSWATGFLILAILGISMSIFAAMGAVAWWFIAMGRVRGNARIDK
ncbi:MAG: hypothetical protein Q8S34_20300 [Hydrogenophaga sp.]|jgi:hypothetical protein|nr:hypothetical protein [Hydrogenophaga sp.]